MPHTSVLLNESLDALSLSSGEVFLDCTLGSAGHSLEVFRKLGNGVRIIGIDADSERLEHSRKLLSEAGCDAYLAHANFRDLDRVLADAGADKVDAILFDLGLNSEQLESSGRGFSFMKDEPLLMTYGEPKTGELAAWEIVNRYDEREIERILRDFGEERQARGIAKSIVARRREKSIETTSELVEAVRKGYRGRFPRSIHFATRTFQALRIAVNDELGALGEGLRKGFDALAAGGRLAVISFHSLEDREVKRFFREKAQAGEAILITKKPLAASDEEKEENPRARSAKLRIIKKN